MVETWKRDGGGHRFVECRDGLWEEDGERWREEEWEDERVQKRVRREEREERSYERMERRSGRELWNGRVSRRRRICLVDCVGWGCGLGCVCLSSGVLIGGLIGVLCCGLCG